MPGGSTPPPKAPQSSFSTPSHHGKSRWEASSSSHAAGAVGHKSSSGPKSKPSPNIIATPSSNRDPSNKHAATRSNSAPDNPSSSRPEGSNWIPEPRPIFPFAEQPPPTPSYGFHILDRRSIALVDGSVRSYFALPSDYENITRMPRPGIRPEFHGFGLDRLPFSVSPEFLGPPQARDRVPEHWHLGPENPMKRKFGEEERGGRDDGFDRQRQQLLQYGNANAPAPSSALSLGRGEETRATKHIKVVQGSIGKLKHGEVDQNALKKAFFHFVKMVFETTNQRKKYLAEGKQGPVSCLPCGRSSKDFPDTHSLIMHAYNSDNADSVIDHLAFHKAVCILMGWIYSMPPDNSKAYQNVSADVAEANRYDLIMWPPAVLIHNTIKGKGKDGRVEGIGNKAMDGILRDIGFTSGKSMSLHSREGFLGMHAIKFPGDETGLKDAVKLADYFERERRGRKNWAQVQHMMLGRDDESNPNLVKLDSKSGEKKRVLYGYLATVADVDKVNYDIRKRVSIVSMRELRESK